LIFYGLPYIVKQRRNINAKKLYQSGMPEKSKSERFTFRTDIIDVMKLERETQRELAVKATDNTSLQRWEN